MYTYFFPIFMLPSCISTSSRGGEISGRSKNIRSKQKYREEVGIHGGNRNTGKK